MDIVDTDAFLDMSPSAQALYFHLGMRADDEGFVANPKKVMRMCGSPEDDFKVLLAKRFILQFESGVCVIKHWKVNNYIQSDRHKETLYLDEKKRLQIKENGVYTECIQNVSNVDTQYSIGKDSIGKDNKDIPAHGAGGLTTGVIDLFKDLNPSYKTLFKRKPQHEAARRLLDLHGLDRLTKIIHFLAERSHDRYCPTITTPSQLEDKWAALEKYGLSLKSQSKGKEIIGLTI